MKRMKSLTVGVVLTLWAALCSPTPAAAQEQKLSDLLVNLVQADIVLAPPPPNFQSHEAHFLPGADQQLAPYFFNQQVVTQLATFPIGTSSGGFSFRFDPALGTFQRVSNSFGPTFAERAFTNGKGKLTLGWNYQYSKYNSFEGKDLDSGDIKFYLRHQEIAGAFFEKDLVQAALDLELSSTTTTIFANYGATDNLDVAIAVPILHVSMDASVEATILRLATEGLGIHQFPGGALSKTFSSSGTATGVGDILVRAKYRFASMENRGLAAGVDLRLPTGDEENLLGSGAAGATFMLIGSSSYGRLAPHFNVGYGFSGKGAVIDVPNEFAYRFGTEFVASPRATLAVDFLGRTLVNAGRLTLQTTNTELVPLEEYVPNDDSLNLASLALGGKFNVGSNLLLNANVLVALTSAGVTARVTPVVGLDYAF